MLGNLENPGVMFLTMMELYRRIDELKDDKICEVAVSYCEVGARERERETERERKRVRERERERERGRERERESTFLVLTRCSWKLVLYYVSHILARQ